MSEIVILDGEKKIGDLEINEIENRFRITFPNDLKEHYFSSNGGRPAPNIFHKNEDFYIVQEFLSIKHGAPGALLEDVYAIFSENKNLPAEAIPFAIDAGGDFFCYRISDKNFGEIFFFQSEYFEDPVRATVYLSPNLADFLTSLVADGD